ncbi:tripartite tricarboxylate transporter TctB family protein [Thermosipho atlanticus]|uniref:Tripartite tricarboxylate transporter TctB family protein n=1 Tax=Thermosipho atlanticus DSM 15807 TaxID=1123380 RepID=A0A1M5RD54_9BACT|nr:tripartite tricarboxylate transporter TctB family protein [Thermosipho atlanticus]SHH23723.1 Tripartite tricarboxylate transporter TctB family protein [Thermosipho atlanticus DSM 15807]
MKVKNLSYGVVLVCISIFVFIYGSNFPDFIVRGNKLPGPKFFPFLISYLLLVVGLYFIIHSIINWKKTKTDSARYITKKGLLRVVSVIIGVGTYVPLINLVGFKIGTFAFATVMMSIFGVKILKSMLYSLILTAIIVLIFEKVFLIPFPQKFFPF